MSSRLRTRNRCAPTLLIFPRRARVSRIAYTTPTMIEKSDSTMYATIGISIPSPGICGQRMLRTCSTTWIAMMYQAMISMRDTFVSSRSRSNRSLSSGGTAGNSPQKSNRFIS